ncbi:MAG TPA: lysylphosphatidylglycerol synthase domain-containing protein [Gaiellales bacterium]|nr:lysylphosphatidylglycerol synthase domain-containing protein [Gaiellales bacterium]
MRLEVAYAAVTLVQLDILSDITGWFGDVWDQIKSVDVQYLVIGCGLQTVQTTLNGLAWRNILAESYGRDKVPIRPIIASYAGGLGLNSFLPAQAGTFAYLGMFRAIITGSAFAGILAGGVVQNLFFGVVGGLNYLYLFLTRPGSADKSANQATSDSGPKVVFLVLAGLLLLIVARFLWKRYRKVWEDAKAGAAILRTPRLYLTRVLVLQVASYAARVGVNANFMYAFGIPVTIRNVFLIIAANSVSSTFAVTPGGVGTQQAMASFALRDVAPASTVTAYSLAQQMILIAWNITFGLVAMASTFGWSATKDMISESRKKSKEKRSLSDLEAEDS